jgi:L-Ala-D/L-Glu epimerase
MQIDISCRHQSWPLAGSFAISRGAKTSTEVVIAEVRLGVHCGQAECTPYPRYGETVDSVLAQIRSVGAQLADPSVQTKDALALLQTLLPAGAARNALDCALLDALAKVAGLPAHTLLGEPAPQPVVSVYTLSLDSAQAMGRAALERANVPLMKLKLAGEGDLERVAAVRANAPNARLIVDANEGWSRDQVVPFSRALADLGVQLIEQPLPANEDAYLAEIEHPVPLCADESCHTRDGLAALVGRYEFVNIKLDKTGGLTEALALRDAARALGFKVMVGCMMASSLAMAPAVLVAQGAEIVDLDGPLWLAQDWPNAMHYDGTVAHPAERSLWG